VTEAEQLARKVLRDAGVDAPPVPVDDIARAHGAQLSFEPFKGGISGMLYRDSERKVIGVNSFHAATRQRFTVAHELGHLLLHETRAMIVDTHVYRRDEVSSMGTKKEEREANAFAAELLMPRDFVELAFDSVLNEQPAITASQLVSRLAGDFEVSEQAMGIRLGNLGILSPLVVEGG
jgi:Zn-dependent peptidase ImmA (M78 family)